MAWEGRTLLAVVCARGGSKGIPRKNLAKVGGLSLIAHAARTALALDWVDRAVLSTDDPEMAEEGRRHGLETPFMRPPELATDSSKSADMWRHAWLASEEHYGCRFELSILLQPTTPLRRPEDVERTVRSLVSEGRGAAATIGRVPAHFAPERILKLGPEGRIEPYLGPESVPSLRQYAPTYYHLDGACYAITRERLMKGGQIFDDDCAGVIVDGFAVNIDEPFELELAEFMHARAGH